MRALVPLLVMVALAGCLEDAPVATPAKTPEAACDARGLAPRSCDTFCALNPATCGLPEPAPMPYPSLADLPPSSPATLPVEGAPGPDAAPDAAREATLRELCTIVPTHALCQG